MWGGGISKLYMRFCSLQPPVGINNLFSISSDKDTLTNVGHTYQGKQVNYSIYQVEPLSIIYEDQSSCNTVDT